MPGRVNE